MAGRGGPAREHAPLLAVLSLALAPAIVAALDVPFLAGHVNDYAHMLAAGEAERLEAELTELEKRNGAQVAILTVDTLGDEAIEDYSMRVAETWKLGQKEKNNGVLLLVAKNDRKMRIEVGYGLEPVLTDAKCSRIVNDVMRPRFRAGEFGEGLAAAAAAISGTIEGKDVLPAEATPGSGGSGDMPWPARLMMLGIFTVVVGAFSLIAIFSSGCQGWFLYAFLMPFYFAFPSAIGGLPFGLAMLAGWALLCPLLRLWFARSPAGRAWLKGHPGWATIGASGGHGGGSGGGWHSSGGFSGGGGSFGGGGSSGSW